MNPVNNKHENIKKPNSNNNDNNMDNDNNDDDNDNDNENINNNTNENINPIYNNNKHNSNLKNNSKYNTLMYDSLNNPNLIYNNNNNPTVYNVTITSDTNGPNYGTRNDQNLSEIEDGNYYFIFFILNTCLLITFIFSFYYNCTTEKINYHYINNFLFKSIKKKNH